jgi:hypothetical protein
MKFWCWVFALMTFAVLPCMAGCGSQLTEEETEIQATDEETTESPVNDADNP